VDTSFDDKHIGKSDFYKQKAEREMKLFYDDRIKEIKSNFEVSLKQTNDEISKREREIHELKNDLNFLSLKLTKESETKNLLEHNMKKQNERLTSDTHKYSGTLNSVN